MAAGRKRLPQSVKMARQTIRYCRENDNEPEYVLPKEMPDPPKYLNKTGRDVYYSVAAELLELGILTRVSLSMFVAYCIEVGRYYQLQEVLAKEGDRVKNRFDEWTLNPALKAANDSLNMMIKLAGEFGITPATQGKVVATPSKKDDKDTWLQKRLK